MAIDLQNPQNIASGWGAAPQFSAPSIGSLVAGVLENRYRNQKLQQDTIADAIKEYQSQRSSRALVEAMQNTGVLPRGDYGNMDEKSAAALAQLYQGQIPDTQRDALLAAQTAEANARAGAISQFGGLGRGRGGGGGRSGSMVTVTDDNGDPILDANGDPVQVPAGSKLGQHVIAQQNTMLGAPSASVAANIATKMGIPPQAITDTGVHQGMGFVPGSGVDAQGNPYQSKYLPVSPGDEPTDIQVSPTGTDPKTQQPYQPVIVQKDTLEQLRRALQGSSYKPPREPDASTGVTPAGVNKGADQLGPDAQARIKAAGGESTDVLTLRKEAQDAIANGKDPEMVKKRFHDMTGGVL